MEHRHTQLRFASPTRLWVHFPGLWRDGAKVTIGELVHLLQEFQPLAFASRADLQRTLAEWYTPAPPVERSMDLHALVFVAHGLRVAGTSYTSERDQRAHLELLRQQALIDGLEVPIEPGQARRFILNPGPDFSERVRGLSMVRVQADTGALLIKPVDSSGTVFGTPLAAVQPARRESTGRTSGYFGELFMGFRDVDRNYLHRRAS
jgi:hypothetical protein